MLSSADYKQLADRSAQLAIDCPAPSVAEALMALALDYMRRAASVSRTPAERQQPARDPEDGYGD
jgi:hypothetical protein